MILKGELKNVAVDGSLLSPDEDPTVVSSEPEMVVLGRLSHVRSSVVVSGDVLYIV